MNIEKTDIEGLFVLQPKMIIDERGIFIKTFNSDLFFENNLQTVWNEEYYSISKKDVIRGMHFQTPPHDHDKIVYCSAGSILDVIVDIREKSDTYKRVFSMKLSQENGTMVYIPKGCAHGFLSLENQTIVNYKVSTVYNPEADKGILWSSIDFDWNAANPILSNRDKNHPNLV